VGTHTVDVEEIQTTRGEKVLAVVLGVFILIGLVWAYDRLDRRTDHIVQPSAAEQAALERESAAIQRVGQATTIRSEALADLVLRRERYRTALDAGRSAPELRRQYLRAEGALRVAGRRLTAARSALGATRPAADAARRHLAAEARALERRDARLTFAFRMTFMLLVLGLSYALFVALRGSRYLTLGLACVGASAVLSLVLTGDYVEDYVEWRHTGPLALSAAGVLLTVAAFWALQRYLLRRLPLRRLRRRECPFCGFPVGDNRRCEGCGHAVVTGCAQCGEGRRVGVAFCGSCGTA
jgi:hypothetical protein